TLAAPGGSGAPPVQPTRTFDDRMELALGGVTFQLLHTPGETPDHLSVWIPQFKAVFVGDNYYDSFPNIYRLRGTRPRGALDYDESHHPIPAVEPALVPTRHCGPIR